MFDKDLVVFAGIILVCLGVVRYTLWEIHKIRGPRPMDLTCQILWNTRRPCHHGIEPYEEGHSG